MEEKPFGTPNEGKPLKSSSAKSPEKGPLEEDDLGQIFEKMHKMHDDLEVKLDAIYQKSGLSPNSIKSFLDNPNNFNGDEWNRIQTQRNRLTNYLGGQIPQPGNLEDKKKEVVQAAKDRKNKTRGARRNWISM